jgi:NAD(P)H-flavin reductase
LELTYTGEVTSSEFISKSVLLIKIKLITPATVVFKAGQYLAVRVPDSDKVSYYSIASSPAFENTVELLVKEDTLGEGARYLFSLKVGSKLSFDAPMGNAYFREDSKRDLIFAVGASGASYARSMLHYLEKNGCLDRQHVYYFMGAHREDELMEADYFHQLAQSIEKFHFIPAISEQQDCSGEQGLITDVMARVLPQGLNHFDAYCAGPKPMVDAVAALLINEKGLDKGHFYSDLYDTI